MKKFLRFNLKTLLVVTAFAALSIGWVVDHRRQATQIEELKEHVRHGTVIINALRSQARWSTPQNTSSTKSSWQ